MAKTKIFRVAVEGNTIDGRKIERSWIEQSAKNYDPNVYGARVWMEHLRGTLHDSAFRAFGDVLSVKAEEVEIKGEKKLALFAEIDATDDLIEINKQRQKIFTSIEIDPDFQGKGEAYLVGLAVTDSPASIGTEKLKFSSMMAKFGENAEKNVFTTAEETKIELEPDSKGVFDGLIQKFSDLFNPKVEKIENEANTNFGELKTVFEKVAEAFTSQETAFKNLQTKHQQLETKFSDLLKKHEDLDKKIEQTPNPNFKQRPVQTGNTADQTKVVY
ncbi:GPO family capsid scaffolding protein [Acinetobacter bereziniae]|uniref:GPO family capsid scaffolding protein n=1 Tax=Acinetobacter bereziniae TaxID=106648 RepID=UPI003AF7486F